MAAYSAFRWPTDKALQKIDMKNRSTTIIWEDEDNVRSYISAADRYGLQILKCVEVDVYKTEVTIYGPSDKVKAFLDDLAEGTVEPLASLSRQYEYDEDYQAALSKAIAAVKA